jgi:hypothetical protein
LVRPRRSPGTVQVGVGGALAFLAAPGDDSIACLGGADDQWRLLAASRKRV